MVRYCAISYCRSSSKNSPRLSFHEFPSNWDRRNLWIESITNNAGQSRELRDYSFVCSLHFTVDCFREGKKNALNLTAIPTIFGRNIQEKQRDVPETTENPVRSPHSVSPIAINHNPTDPVTNSSEMIEDRELMKSRVTYKKKPVDSITAHYNPVISDSRITQDGESLVTCSQNPVAPITISPITCDPVTPVVKSCRILKDKGAVVGPTADDSNPEFVSSSGNVAPVTYESGILVWKDSGVWKVMDKVERMKDPGNDSPNPRFLISSGNIASMASNCRSAIDTGVDRSKDLTADSFNSRFLIDCGNAVPEVNNSEITSDEVILMDESNTEPAQSNLDSDDDPLGSTSVEQRQKKIINKLYVRLSRAKKKTSKLVTENESLKSRLAAADENLLAKMTEIKKGAEKNDPFCVFIMDQINNRFRKRKSSYRWSDIVVKNCRTFRAFNPEAYARMIRSELMILPQRRTLNKKPTHRSAQKNKNTDTPNPERPDLQILPDSIQGEPPPNADPQTDN